MTLHKFNTDTLHFITTGIEKNIGNYKDIKKVMTKFSATFPILSTAKSSEHRKRKEISAKAIGARFILQRLERREPVSYFCLWGAHQLALTSIIH